MAFYTFCDRVGGKLYHRYVDDNGKRQQEIVTDAPFELFTKGDGGYVSLYSEKLKRIDFESVREMVDYVKNYKDMLQIYGRADPVSQFISNTYKGKIEFDLSKMKILNFDIETRFDGCDDDEEVRTRMVFGLTETMMTVEDLKRVVRQQGDDPATVEVWDDVNQRWYPAHKAPQLNAGGFPHAKNADYEILTISAKVFGNDKRVTFGLHDYEQKHKDQLYIKCDDEADLLRKFIGFWRQVDPDIITGWNIEWFDVPYIVNRIVKVLGEAFANKLSPFHAHTSKCISEYFNDDKSDVGFRILGVTALDYIDIYKKYNPDKQESYRLDDISEIELKENKIDFSEFDNNLMKLYVGNFEKYIDYNEQDVYLVERLDDKKQFIRLAVTMVLMTKSRYKDVHGKVKLWDNLIFNMLRDENIQLPPDPKIGAKEKIIGAYVKKPIPGKYRYIVSLDLTALYPSICMMFNMSPETLVTEARGEMEIVEALLGGADLARRSREKGLAMTANGAEFRLDIDGVLPRAMKMVFDTRKSFKDLMKVHKKQKEALLKEGVSENDPRITDLDNLIAAADATQGAMKVLANSGYGVTANVAFRYFSKTIAQGITLTGQLVIRHIGDQINAKLNELFGTNKDYIITSDTDSVYIYLDNVPSDPLNAEQSIEELDQFVESELQPFITHTFEELGRKLGAPKNLLDMKREALSDVGIWRAGKNYALQVWDMEGVRYATPELKMMGIETARSDKPKIVRKRLEGDIKVLLNGTEKELQARIKEFKEIFHNSPIEQIAKPMGVSTVSAWTDSQGRPKPGTPWQSKASIDFNRILREKKLERKYERIRNGNKIKLFTLKKINPLQGNYIAFLTQLPEDLGMHPFLDYNAQWESTYLSPIKSFTDIIGWQVEKVNTLESLFG